MYKIVAGATSRFDSGDDGCRGHTWGPSLNISSNIGQPYILASNPEVKAAGCRCCEPASSQCDVGAGAELCKTFTYAECSSLCSNLGGRVCTEAEVLSGSAQGTGCEYDAMHVWTSTLSLLDYAGCFSDNRTDSPLWRKLPAREMKKDATVEGCQHACREYRFFGLQRGGQCWCGNGPDIGRRLSELQCNKPCDADPAQTCGGLEQNSVYKAPYRYEQFHPVCAAPISAPATSSSALLEVGGRRSGFFSDPRRPYCHDSGCFDCSNRRRHDGTPSANCSWRRDTFCCAKPFCEQPRPR